MTVGERIKEKREACDMTLEELSKHVGVSRQTLSRYETGVIKGVPSDKLELIAQTLNTTPAYLMGWEDSPEIKQAAAQAAFRAEMGNLSYEEMDIVRAYRQASPEVRAIIDKIIER